MKIDNIYQGDCVGIMKLFPENIIDLTMTSPPYNVGIEYDIYNDNLTEKEYWDFTEKWIKEVYRITKIGGRICINIPIMGNNPKMKKSNSYLFHLPQYLEILKQYFKLRECISWIKSYKEYDENVFCGGNTAWGSWLSPSNPFCRSFSEFILIAHKELPKIQHRGETDLTKDEFLKFTKNVWFLPIEAKRLHPAQYPEELPYRCIKLFSWMGDLIFDPFSGVGTTCLVANKLKRKYIGIELSKKYCDIAKERLKNIQQGLF